MKARKYLIVSLMLVLILQSGAGQVGAQDSNPDDPLAALGTAFTYQGLLENNGNPVTAVCDIRFGLWDALTSGTQIGSLSTVTNVQVTNGLFTVSVNAGGEFGTSAFTGSARWLAIETRCPAGSGNYTALTPRQAITLVPYAAHADLLDGQHGTYYRSASNINAGTLGTGYYSAYGDLTAEGYLGNAAGDLALNNGILQSTLNTDLLDGQEGTYYRSATNINAGVLGTGYYSAYGDLTAEGYLGNAAGDLAMNNGTLQSTLNADMLDGAHSSYYQRRVSGACDVGSTIRAINSDGTVVCQNDAPLNRTGGPQYNQNVSIDNPSSDDNGRYSSITIGADGLPIISFYDVTNQSLGVAHCEQADCSGTINLTTVDTGNVGMHSSIAIGADGLPIISYYDATNGDLKVAHCEDVACTGSATITTVDNSSSDVGQYSSIAVGSDGNPIISYNFASPIGSFLFVAHCTNTTCTTAPVITHVDPNSGTGQYTSIAISPSGLAAISYYDASNDDLKFASCSNFDCSSSSLHVVDSTDDVGQYSSLIFGNDGLPIISYYDATGLDLKVAHCDGSSCSTANTYTVYSSGNAGLYSSITIGADGLPVVSFSKGSEGLRVAHCADTTCSRADTSAPMSGTTIEYTAITIGADGLPIISFYNTADFTLRTMHCASNLCLSYYWRR